MEHSVFVFCTARPKAVNRALNAVVKDLLGRSIFYIGPDDSPFTRVEEYFFSWGKGPFNLLKIFRLFSKVDRKSKSIVVLPLNRADGRGYFALRLFAKYIGDDYAEEVTPEGKNRVINLRCFLDTYRIEEALFGFLISLLNFLKLLFVLWLKPTARKAEAVLTKERKLSYTLIKEFESDQMPVASIIIRTYNEERFLAETLDMVFRQKGIPMETIVIDSESTDATTEIAWEFPVRLIKIKKECFGYGAALNLGTRLARGRYVVNLSAHAVPTEENWLKQLVGPLQDSCIAGVHGAEKPMEGHCGLLERKILLDSFSEIPVDRWNDSFFSNANSAMRRELVLDHPFDESVVWAEDRLWAKRMQDLGYKTAYRPQAAVYHSHNLSPKRNFDRSFKFFTMQFGTYYQDRVEEVRNGYREKLPERVVLFRRFLSDRKLMTLPLSFFYAPFCEFVNYLGCEFAWKQVKDGS